MTAPAQRRIRVLAVSTLLALGGAALCLWLTFAFPNLGSAIYDPPQTWLPVMLVPTAVGLALTTCISSLSQSRRARQPFWIGAFTVILLLLLLGPIYLIC